MPPLCDPDQGEPDKVCAAQRPEGVEQSVMTTPDSDWSSPTSRSAQIHEAVLIGVNDRVYPVAQA